MSDIVEEDVPSDRSGDRAPDRPAPSWPTYVVRYGVARQLGEFSAKGLPPLARQQNVIVRCRMGRGALLSE